MSDMTSSDMARAAKVSRDIERQANNAGAGDSSGLVIFKFLINPISYIVAACKRHAARKALDAGKVDEAAAFLASAKKWQYVGLLVGLLVWGLAFWIVWSVFKSQTN